MEGRMTVCNMSIEWGARAGMIAPDEVTYAYLQGRPHAPADWDAAVAAWDALRTDDDAVFDKEVVLDATAVSPFVTWGTNPAQGVALVRCRPRPRGAAGRQRPRRRGARPRLHGPRPPAPRCATSRSTPSSSAPAPTAAWRTCAPRPTSSRASKVADAVRMLVVPGSMLVKAQAEQEGLDARLHRCRCGVAQRRLLDVPGHEPRHPHRRRAQRLDQQPQLRGPAGPRRPHPPRLAPGGRRHRRRRAASPPRPT